MYYFCTIEARNQSELRDSAARRLGTPLTTDVLLLYQRDGLTARHTPYDTITRPQCDSSVLGYGRDRLIIRRGDRAWCGEFGRGLDLELGGGWGGGAVRGCCRYTTNLLQSVVKIEGRVVSVSRLSIKA